MKSGNEHYHRLKALEHLQLPQRIFVAAFLAEIHHVLPSLSNSFCWLNRQNQPVDIYDEINSYALSETLGRLLPAVNASQTSVFSQFADQSSLINTASSELATSALKRFYRRAFFPCGYHHTLLIPIAHHQDKSKGFLLINRSRHQQPFSKAELAQAQEIKTLVEEGLAKKTPSWQMTTTGWQSGLIIVDETAELLQCCPTGINLLALATQRKTGQLGHHRLMDVRAVPGMYQLIQNQLSMDNPSDNSLIIHSLWGEFHVSAYPVIDEIGNRAPQVHLNISWQVPFSLKLFHNIRYLDLTPRQEMIALLYASGEPTKTIASLFGLSLYTVKEHVHNIFDKLQIHTRAELIEYTICQGQLADQRPSEQRHLDRAERATMNLRRS